MLRGRLVGRSMMHASRALGASLCMTAVLGASAGDGSRLIQAVRDQNVALARQLVADGVDVNAVQGDGASALHWAAHRGDLSTVDLLIRSGARVNLANDLGATPLQVACETREGAVVEHLLAAGADPNATLLNGETVLMTCARAGDVPSVAALLAHDAAVNVAEVGHKQTPLMWAAARGHADVVRLLVRAGADIRARSLTYPRTVVDEQTQRAGREELNYTVLRGGSTPLLFAARNGDVASATVLLDAGAGPNDSLSDGTSALVLAAHSGHGDLGTLLLERGANPNNVGIGYTALHVAVLRSDLQLVEALLQHGADPNVRMTRGTPLRRNTTDYNLHKTLVSAAPYFLAAKFLEPAIMRSLVRGGADPNLAMDDGTTPLMAAVGMGARRGSRRGISLIDVGGTPPTEAAIQAAVLAGVELGGDVNAYHPGNGETALHVAAVNEFPNVVKVLSEHGAVIDATDGEGRTALGILWSRLEQREQAPEESATVQLLRSYGAVREP